jgi:hypothetical protein
MREEGGKHYLSCAIVIILVIPIDMATLQHDTGPLRCHFVDYLNTTL